MQGKIVFNPDNATDDQIIAHALQILRTRVKRNGVQMGSAEDVKSYLALQYGMKKEEVFGVIYLDSQYGLLSIKEMFQGTNSKVHVYNRPIVREALEQNASFAILYHNHPSGRREPSEGDIEMTCMITEALSAVDVKVLDHMIVAGSHVTSFVETNREV